MSWLKELPSAYKDKTVLVTGHTGFKGAWLCEWLLMLGARVVGVSLPPPTEPSLFEQLGLAGRLEHHIQDIRELGQLRKIVLATQPDYLFHLAAQPLVRDSYRMPVETYATNVMGTIHTLEGLRALDEAYAGTGRTCAAVLITTDKVYENHSWVYGYRENDPLGGYDPYSSSKAAAEIAIAAFRSSFFNPERLGLRVGIASARAGNVIGGGDWAADRIVPDCIRALAKGEAVAVRNPESTRPWQHVLEPLGGYLHLARLLRDALEADPGVAKGEALRRIASSFNFGPPAESNRCVRELVEEVLRHWPGEWREERDLDAPHEAAWLTLATDKAHDVLGWHPRWIFPAAVARTVAWYRLVREGAKPGDITRQDITGYLSPRETDR
jgi:CDP-glucose 4,6-dehydratase